MPLIRKFELENEFTHCRVALIMWMASYMHQLKKNTDGGSPSLISHSATSTSSAHQDDDCQHESAHASLDSSWFFCTHVLKCLCYYFFLSNFDSKHQNCN